MRTADNGLLACACKGAFRKFLVEPGTFDPAVRDVYRHLFLPLYDNSSSVLLGGADDDLVRRTVADPASADALKRLLLGDAFENVVLVPADDEANFEWLELIAAMAPDHVRVMRFEPRSNGKLFEKGEAQAVFDKVFASGRLRRMGEDMQTAARYVLGDEVVAYAPPDG